MLLTAKHDKVSQLAGWQEHIDDYMTKPFEPGELLLRVENILSIRKLVQMHYLKQFSRQVPVNGQAATLEQAIGADLPFNDMSGQLIERINLYIGKRIDDPTLKVGDIADEVGMNEKQLNRKLKALLNITLNEHIRQQRLLLAKQLLNQGHLPSMVYHNVGFTSHTYFTRCYKAFFNTAPSQDGGLANEK